MWPRSSLLAVVIVPLVFGSFIWAGSGCSGKNSTAILAKVLRVEEQSNRAPTETEASRIHQGQQIAAGETCRLAPSQKITVAFTPGIMVTMFNQAEVFLAKLRMAKDGNETGYDLIERDLELHVSKGSLIGSVAADALKTRFVIVTDTGNLSFESGSLFYLDFSPDGLRVTSIRGTIRLTGKDGRATTLGSGEWLVWPKNAPTPAEAKAAAGEARAQEDVTSALEAEAEMQSLLAAEQKEVPPWRHP